MGGALVISTVTCEKLERLFFLYSQPSVIRNFWDLASFQTVKLPVGNVFYTLSIQRGFLKKNMGSNFPQATVSSSPHRVREIRGEGF